MGEIFPLAECLLFFFPGVVTPSVFAGGRFLRGHVGAPFSLVQAKLSFFRGQPLEERFLLLRLGDVSVGLSRQSADGAPVAFFSGFFMSADIAVHPYAAM